ncbi:MAG: serine/threonine-protein kinase [Myxococcota bacterium]
MSAVEGDARSGTEPPSGIVARPSRDGEVAPDDTGVEDAEEPDDAPDPYLGRTIGERYDIRSLLGEGGMGRVYLGHHNRLGKRVAVKVLRAELARDKGAVGRFVREARASSSVGSPHIVDVMDFGELPDGATYFVMEYLDGETLAAYLERQGPLSPESAIDIGRQLCSGLAAAHAKDIIHRDLKPENVVLVAKGDRTRFCKILDFGIAKVSGGVVTPGAEKLTLAGTVFGTPHYMSPEQAAGSTVDHRADIYSLGVMLYELVAGALPFDADNFMGLLTQHMFKPPPPLGTHPAGVQCPPEFEAIVLKCLAKRPEARYASMADLDLDLARLAEGIAPLASEEDDPAARTAIPAELAVRAQLASGVDASGGSSLPSAPSPVRTLTPKLVAIASLGVGLAVGAGGYFAMKGEPSREARASAPNVDASGPSLPAAAPPAGLPPSASRSVEAGASGVTDRTASSEEAGAGATNEASEDDLIPVVPVLLHSPVPGAVAHVDGEPILLPANVDISLGGAKDIEVHAPGYHGKRIRLDDTRPRVQVFLAPRTSPGGRTDPYDAIAPRPRAIVPPPPPASPPTTGGADEIVEPWPD